MSRAGERDSRVPGLATIWAVGVLGIVAATLSFALVIRASDEPVPVVHAALVGWIVAFYVLCGLVVWRQGPDGRFGAVMVAAGFAPFLSTLSVADAGVAQTVGEICQRLPIVVFLHLFLSYPTGRLEGRLARLVVVTAYVVVLGSGLAQAVLGGQGTNNLLALVDWSTTAEVVRRTQAAGVFVLMIAAVWLFVARWRRSGRTPRRTGNLVLGTCLLALAVLAVGGFVAAQFGSAVSVRWVTYGLLAFVPVALLSRMVGARLARTSVAGLFVELRAEPAPADLQDALARALGDRSLTLAYWVPDFRTYVDLDGRAIELDSQAGRATTPIERNGAHVGALQYDSALTKEPELLDAVTAAAGIAIENARLHAELRARLEELRGSRARVLEAGQSERKRLERNLHDGAQQRLIALSLELSLLEGRLEGDRAATSQLALARAEIAASLEELREVARGLHPAVVSAHGLDVALEQLVARAAVPVQLTVAVGRRLPEALEVAAFYLVSESLANVAKYAEASSARVEVTRREGDVVVEVADDGIGGADESGGSGLRGLADRVEALGGTLRVWSPAGRGTRVRAEIPCAR